MGRGGEESAARRYAENSGGVPSGASSSLFEPLDGEQETAVFARSGSGCHGRFLGGLLRPYLDVGSGHLGAQGLSPTTPK